MWYKLAKVNYKELIKERKLVASIVVFKKEKNKIQVLLERRGSKPEKHKWALPGGHVENNETPEKAASRELKEETNLTIKPNDLIYIGHHDQEPYRDKFNYIYAAEYKGNETMQAMSDAEYMEWFDVDKIPPLLWENNKYLRKAYKKIYNKDLNHSDKRGLLIAFEGLDGAGKSSQVKSLEKYLKDISIDYITTRWNDGKKTKPSLKNHKNKINMNPEIYSLLHIVDLLERYESEIVPALDNDKVVICDRYYPTSIVRDSLRNSTTDFKFFKNHLREPDIIFYLKAPHSLCVKRIKDRDEISYYAAGMDLNLHPDQDTNMQQYFKLMFDEYEKLFKNKKNVHTIDSTKSLKQITKEIQTVVDQFLNGK